MWWRILMGIALGFFVASRYINEHTTPLAFWIYVAIAVVGGAFTGAVVWRPKQR